MAKKITNRAQGRARGRYVAVSLLIGLVLAVGAAAWAFAYAHRPLALAMPTDFELTPGSFNKAAEQLQAQGIIDDARLFILFGRLIGADKRIKAGSYEINKPTSLWQLLQKLTTGETAMVAVKVLEGWNWRQLKAELAKHAHLSHDATSLPEEQLIQALQLPVKSLEGQFFPDTYFVNKGGSELQLLKRAHRLLQHKLDAAWVVRSPGLPLANPHEALILASLIEKETGKPSDRAEIAGVFINRLKIGMRLQTDPSVIYGLGAQFDANLRRIDLETDTPWNTYTRAGLTPTPIAFVGEAALLAATQPAQTRALYFVARGDGSSHFSRTLDEHNAAVRRYQLGR